MAEHDMEQFDTTRLELLNTAAHHYTPHSPEYTAFLAGAGYVLARGVDTQDTVILETPVESFQYTAENEDEIAQWIAESTDYALSVAIVGGVLHIGNDYAEYGDIVERYADNSFRVQKSVF